MARALRHAAQAVRMAGPLLTQIGTAVGIQPNASASLASMAQPLSGFLSVLSALLGTGHQEDVGTAIPATSATQAPVSAGASDHTGFPSAITAEGPDARDASSPSQGAGRVMPSSGTGSVLSTRRHHTRSGRSIPDATGSVQPTPLVPGTADLTAYAGPSQTTVSADTSGALARSAHRGAATDGPNALSDLSAVDLPRSEQGLATQGHHKLSDSSAADSAPPTSLSAPINGEVARDDPEGVVVAALRLAASTSAMAFGLPVNLRTVTPHANAAAIAGVHANGPSRAEASHQDQSATPKDALAGNSAQSREALAHPTEAADPAAMGKSRENPAIVVDDTSASQAISIPPSSSTTGQSASLPVSSDHQDSVSASDAHAATEQILPAAIGLLKTGGDGATVIINLRPPDLGQVGIRVNDSAGGAPRIDILAARPETLQLLQRDEPRLQQALDQAGVASSGRVVTFAMAPDLVAASARSGGFAADPGGFGQGQNGGFWRQNDDGQGASEQSADSEKRQNQARWFRAGLDITA